MVLGSCSGVPELRKGQETELRSAVRSGLTAPSDAVQERELDRVRRPTRGRNTAPLAVNKIKETGLPDLTGLKGSGPTSKLVAPNNETRPEPTRLSDTNEDSRSVG